VSPEVWNVLDLALCVLCAAGFSYYYVVGVHFRDRALSRTSALAALASFAAAVVFLIRTLR